MSSERRKVWYVSAGGSIASMPGIVPGPVMVIDTERVDGITLDEAKQTAIAAGFLHRHGTLAGDTVEPYGAHFTIPSPGPGPIEEAFWQFHEANPRVYKRLVAMARDLADRGRTKLSIGMLFEVLRYEHLTTVGDPDFKLNNNYRALYARLIMHQEPDLAGRFDLRRLHGAAEPFGQVTTGPDGHVAPPRFDPEVKR